MICCSVNLGREVDLWAQGGLWWPLEPHLPRAVSNQWLSAAMTLEKPHPWETWVSWGVISGLLVAINDARARSIAL